MKRFAVVCRSDETSKNIVEKIRKELCNHATEDNVAPQTIFVIGGDGTFLNAVHKYLDILEEVKFIGVHTGTLGFMTDYQVEELDELINDYIHNEPEIDELNLLEVTFNNQVVYAMNEMRIENAVKTQILDVEINGIYFETFRGTGMCLATQMGSTAYNRSIMGAVIEHGLSLLQLSEIAGIHHRAYRSLQNSIILKKDSHISFYSDCFEGAILCYDHCSIYLKNVTEVHCKLSKKSVRIARYRSYHYLSRLKNLF